MTLRQIPCGALATGFKPYPGGSDDDDDSGFPVCKHGGWQECGLQSQQLCAKNLTGDALSMASLVDCHFAAGSAGGAGVLSPTAGKDCAAQLGLDYSKVYQCAFEGQYPVPYGLGLLSEAFSEQNERAIKAVPSMFLNGQLTMAWSDTPTLLAAVCAAYTGPSAPAGCAPSNIERLRKEAALRDSSRRQTELCSVLG